MIDVRETNEVNSVIGSGSCSAYNIPLISGAFENAVDMFPADTAIILYCASGYRSSQAASELQSLGFTEVYSLTGGMNSWNGPTVPVNKEKSLDLFPATFCSTETPVINTITRANLANPESFQLTKHFDLQGRTRNVITPGLLLRGKYPAKVYLKSAASVKP